jgi:hypothetical protein
MSEFNKEAMMKAWAEAAALGAKHKALEHFLGSWETTNKVWMEGPAGPATESKGTVESRWLVEGRWLIEEVNGEMMGQPFRGIAVTGYDNVKKKYVGIWIDNMSTAMMRFEGNFFDEGRTFVLYGGYDDPFSGEHDRIQRYVTRIQGDDRHTMEIHDMSMGLDGAKMMEMEYRRKKK